MYDAIVIGARCAGAPAAMLLARKGYKILLLDRATFPSDTLSTHQVQIKGGAALQRWGLLEKVIQSNSPPVSHVRFHADPYTFEGDYPPLDGVDILVSPRRTILDKILVDAAVAAGVELRQDFLVEDLLVEEDTVTGVRGRQVSSKSGGSDALVEKSRLVIGADGKRSLVAKAVQAQEYRTKPTLTCAYYTYWQGLEMTSGDMYTLPKSVVGVWPTNDDLALIYTAYPIHEFPEVRGDIEGKFWKTIDSLPGLAERVHNGRQAERFYGTGDLPAFYRNSHGSGWALVGDAAMTMDPITGQGIGNAFLDAERLAAGVDAAFSGKTAFEKAMAEGEQQRLEDTLALYDFTSQLAAFSEPTLEQQTLFAALEYKQDAANQFFGVLTGSVSFQKFFAPSNLFRIIGAAGMGRIMLNQALHSLPRPKKQHDLAVQEEKK